MTKGTSALPSVSVVKAREVAPETFIPYVRHVDETTIALDSRALMVMIAIEGVSFETADPLDLNGLHRDLNTLYRNLADERLALWTHIVRHRDNDYPDGAFANPFSAELNAKYRARMVDEDLFRNDLYLTLLWYPSRDPAERIANLLSRLRKARRTGIELDEDALKHLRDKVVDVTAGLKRFRAANPVAVRARRPPVLRTQRGPAPDHRRPARARAADRR